jgi:hypothetical protein
VGSIEIQNSQFELKRPGAEQARAFFCAGGKSFLGDKKVPAPIAARVLGTAGHAHDTAFLLYWNWMTAFTTW